MEAEDRVGGGRWSGGRGGGGGGRVESPPSNPFLEINIFKMRALSFGILL